MGFRDYNPGLNRFLTRDTYNGALADLNLGTNPWTGNRYAFTGGNPISRIEIDGHTSVDDRTGQCGERPVDCMPAADPNHVTFGHGTTADVDAEDEGYVNGQLVPPPAFNGPDPRGVAARVDALMDRPENAWYADFVKNNRRFATFYMINQVCSEDPDFCGKSYHSRSRER